MFHHFTDQRHPAGQGAITADELRRLLEWFGPQRFLPAREWLTRRRAGTLGDKLCLTFDDNLRCQYDVAVPVLDDMGLTALWFVYSSPLEGVAERLEVYRYFRTVAFDDLADFYDAFDSALRASEWAELVAESLRTFTAADYLTQFAFYTDGDRRFRYLRDRVLGPEPFFAVMDSMIDQWEPGVDLVDFLWMNADHWSGLHRAGHVIGMHSHTHPTDIGSLEIVVQRAEYEANQQAIAQVTGEMPTVVAHPASSYTNDTLALLRELGVDIGFTSTGPVKFDAELEVTRFDHADLMKEAGLSA